MQAQSLLSAEAIHPSLWRASQLARSSTVCIGSGHTSLDRELPGGGWPTGVLVELLIPQSGTAELSLLSLALGKLGGRRIALVQPPHQPQSLALSSFGLSPSQFLWIRSKKSGDALWASEQILRTGSCGALLLWQNHIRHESLRRLHLAAQSNDTLFFMVRPLACADQPSPAALRLGLQPVHQGLQISFIKRRGASRDVPLLLSSSPLLRFFDHALVDSLIPAFAPAGSISPALAE